MYSEDPFAHNRLLKRAINALVRERLPTITGTVVDLGCGAAPFREDIARRSAHEYVGVDWSNTLHDSRADIVADLNQPLPAVAPRLDRVWHEDRETAGYFVTARKP